MQITAQMVKELRERTGAGMMDCKNALTETGGNFEQAVDLLRKKGLAAAAKRSGRVAAEGLVSAYIHAGGKIGVLIEVNCETDFVARTEEFQELVRDVAMHIAAAEPRYVERSEVTPEILEREKAIYRDQAMESGKPANVVEKIVEGKMEKFYAMTCLVEQGFVKDPEQTITELLAAKSKELGDTLAIRRFTRYQVGQA